ncbi:hypothetical protein RCL1_004868 [Eukaryota sp. TZLM3-RCL]
MPQAAEFPLSVSPSSLVFPSATDPSTIDIELSNSLEIPVFFKLKTTSRDGYFVRPPVGLVPSKSAVSVRVELHPHKTTPEKDKFLIQAYVPPHANLDTSGLSRTDFVEAWQLIERDSSKKSQVVYLRLRCSTSTERPPIPKFPRPSPLQNEEQSDDNASPNIFSTGVSVVMKETVDDSAVFIKKEETESIVVITPEELEKLKEELTSVEIERDRLNEQLINLTEQVEEYKVTEREQQLLLDSKKQDIEELRRESEKWEVMVSTLKKDSSSTESLLLEKDCEIVELKKELEEKSERLQALLEYREKNSASSSLAVKLAIVFAILAFIMFLRGFK